MSRHHNVRREAPPAKAALKVVFNGSEYALADARITIGRAKDAVIQINDGLVSGKHALISNGIVSDQGSTNGTFLNGKQLKPTDKIALKAGDRVTCGDAELLIERGEVKVSVQEKLRSSQRFPEKNSAKVESKEEVKKVESAEDKMTVEELMEEEFKKIIGHDKIKAQLRQFHKKVQLDNIRLQNGKIKEKPRLYHMIFSGPPGTGKTTMANVVSKIMLKMKLVTTDKVVFVNNPLELLGGYVGQTAPKVDAKVEEAKGGILFIDEAYSIVKSSSKENHSFGREAIDTIMKHLDPPTAVFIFAGYETPMEEFLKVNEGLARRIPYRYTFEAYNMEQLQAIFEVMCDSKGEHIDAEIISNVESMLNSLPANMLATQNAGLVNNWVSFAQIERDDRVDIDEVLANPDLASILSLADFQKALEKVKQMV